jgi:hypothetical protein
VHATAGHQTRVRQIRRLAPYRGREEVTSRSRYAPRSAAAVAGSRSSAARPRRKQASHEFGCAYPACWSGTESRAWSGAAKTLMIESNDAVLRPCFSGRLFSSLAYSTTTNNRPFGEVLCETYDLFPFRVFQSGHAAEINRQDLRAPAQLDADESAAKDGRAAGADRQRRADPDCVGLPARVVDGACLGDAHLGSIHQGRHAARGAGMVASMRAERLERTNG